MFIECSCFCVGARTSPSSSRSSARIDSPRPPLLSGSISAVVAGSRYSPRPATCSAGEREVHDAVGDLADLLGRNVARLPERARRDGEAVEDVLGVVAGDLVDLARPRPVGGEHLPARLDHQPGDGVGHSWSLPGAPVAPVVLDGRGELLDRRLDRRGVELRRMRANLRDRVRARALVDVRRLEPIARSRWRSAPRA